MSKPKRSGLAPPWAEPGSSPWATPLVRSAGSVALTVLLLALWSSPASARPLLGIGDQKPSMFSDPLYRPLGMTTARFVVAWDAVLRDPAELDAWLQAARASGVNPLIAFNHRPEDRCPDEPCKLPSLDEYGKAFMTFRERYPWVKDITPWNEPNHYTQPTFDHPAWAAHYYNEIRDRCPRCTVVAGDFLDSSHLDTWIRIFLRHAASPPSVWGLHNYSDANRFRGDGLRTMLQMVRGKIWLTETGGIVRLRSRDGEEAFPYDEERAARALHYVLALARVYADRVSRIYLYHWKAPSQQEDARPGSFFDAGLVSATGAPRPGLEVLYESRGLSGLGVGGGTRRLGRSPPIRLRPLMRLRTTRTRTRSGGKFVVHLECLGPGRCVGRLRITTRHPVRSGDFRHAPARRWLIAKAPLSVPAGQTKRITLQTPAVVARMLRRRRARGHRRLALRSAWASSDRRSVRIRALPLLLDLSGRL